jgi:hypothetical protein
MNPEKEMRRLKRRVAFLHFLSTGIVGMLLGYVPRRFLP